jgi:hypothetical protein
LLELIAADRQQELVCATRANIRLGTREAKPLEARRLRELDAIPGALDRARARSAELREGHAVPLRRAVAGSDGWVSKRGQGDKWGRARSLHGKQTLQAG